MQWQPIETAPKDRTSVLIATEDGLVTEVFFEDDKWMLFCAGIYDCYWLSEKPTHWMPLPLPPQKGE
jgi:hypothetical protein